MTWRTESHARLFQLVFSPARDSRHAREDFPDIEQEITDSLHNIGTARSPFKVISVFGFVKKEWTEADWKEQNRKRAERSLRSRTLWKRRKTDERRLKLGVPSPHSVPEDRRRSAQKFKAPPVLSLVESPDETVRFFRALISHSKNRDVFVDLSEVTTITPDAIALLLAIVMRITNRGELRVRGNYPDDHAATETISESGFNEYLRTSAGKSSGRRGAIVRQDALEQSKKADGAFARRLIDFAEAEESNRMRLKMSYAHLVECMGNTHQHAGRNPGTQTWWASVFRDSRRGRDCFTFVDMGMGILSSAELSLRLKIHRIFGWTPEVIMRELLAGKIPSSTGKSYRGNGLPSIYRSCRDGKIKRFVMLTDNIFVDAEQDKFKRMSQQIEGVILYWEVPHEGRGAHSLV